MDSFDAELQKAKDIIAKSEHIALLLPERPDTDEYAAAEAIAAACAAAGKHTAFLASVGADAPTPPDAFTAVLNPSPLTREFVISIDTARSPISQLRYEKRDDKIEVILSPKTSPVSEDALSFREGNVQCDSVIAINIPDIEALAPIPGIEPAFFAETPLIALRRSGAEGAAYGDADLAPPEAKDASLCEIAYRFITSALGPLPDAAAATALLVGITASGDGFQSFASAEAHRAAADLITAGADPRRAAQIASKSYPLALRQLIARASVRSKETDHGRVLWSFLTADDFEKTGRGPDDAPHVLSGLASILSPHPISVLFWQDPARRTVRAALRAEPAILSAIAAQEPGVSHNPSLTIAAEFEHFAAAEERIATLLRAVL